MDKRKLFEKQLFILKYVLILLVITISFGGLYFVTLYFKWMVTAYSALSCLVVLTIKWAKSFYRALQARKPTTSVVG